MRIKPHKMFKPNLRLSRITTFAKFAITFAVDSAAAALVAEVQQITNLRILFIRVSVAKIVFRVGIIGWNGTRRVNACFCGAAVFERIFQQRLLARDWV